MVKRGVGEGYRRFLCSIVGAELEDINKFTTGMKDALEEIITTHLTPREIGVLRFRFGLNDGIQRTLEEVGKEFYVTRERVRQVESKALRKIRRQRVCDSLRRFFNADT